MSKLTISVLLINEPSGAWVGTSCTLLCMKIITSAEREVKDSRRSGMYQSCNFYFGGARSKGFATLRNVSKLQFFDKIGQTKSVGFRFYSAIRRTESRISSRYLEITSISLIYSVTFSRKKE